MPGDRDEQLNTRIKQEDKTASDSKGFDSNVGSLLLNCLDGRMLHPTHIVYAMFRGSKFSST